MADYEEEELAGLLRLEDNIYTNPYKHYVSVYKPKMAYFNKMQNKGRLHLLYARTAEFARPYVVTNLSSYVFYSVKWTLVFLVFTENKLFERWMNRILKAFLRAIRWEE